MPEAQNSSLAPQKIETERKQPENEDVSQTSDLIAIGPKWIRSQKDRKTPKRREPEPFGTREMTSSARRSNHGTSDRNEPGRPETYDHYGEDQYERLRHGRGDLV